ncbi:DinB family protein [Fictibacillus phosphorivorans]|uniref:DinB family protein n=1 Tax=Fictibacillus phosphorivorans TaxID=1221500 RepID=UPI0012933B70|nr:DinB family protein [Fictibacillus phosphorivorans]MQR97116.1 DinB family protein [Fictibacillus phosphorivorans]
MYQKTILLNQMAANHNEPNWFVPIERALEGLTTEQASEKSGDSNSIWEIVNHLIFWNERYLERFKGNSPVRKIESNDETFENENNQEWETVKKQLFSVLNDWAVALKEADDSIFEISAHEDRHDPWYSVLANINIHNAYHIGQIVEIRKSKGNWDSNKGVH